MAKRRKVAKRPRHIVNAILRADDLAKLGAALRIVIRAPDEKHSELQVGQGGLRWRGRNDKKFRRITWERFANKMEKGG